MLRVGNYELEAFVSEAPLAHGETILVPNVSVLDGVGVGVLGRGSAAHYSNTWITLLKS